MRTPGLYSRCGKRAVDLVGAGIGIVLLLPVMAGIALLIRCSLGSPVLFRQRRPGLHGVPFVMVKFRSMAERLTRSTVRGNSEDSTRQISSECPSSEGTSTNQCSAL